MRLFLSADREKLLSVDLSVVNDFYCFISAFLAHHNEVFWQAVTKNKHLSQCEVRNQTKVKDI